MLTTMLMFIAAIALSAVAGYYSVIGLTSIFAGAFVPIVIMAGILETSKIIVASWLYNNWRQTPLALKSYLTVAVVVLMLITSMGIFGFLSKAHVEQAAAGQEQQAKLDKIASQILNQNAMIAQASDRLANVGRQGNAQTEAINSRIADANKIISDANQQIQPQIDAQQKIIDGAAAKMDQRAKSIQAQIDDIDRQVSNLDGIVRSLIDQKQTGLATQRQREQKTLRDQLAKQKAQLTKQIDDLRQAPDSSADAARAEISRLHARVDEQVRQARELINTLTAKLESGTDVAKMQGDLDAQNDRIKAAQDEIDRLTAEKYKIEAETRKLEVEVGPLKYIAQLIYGDSPDGNLLERAVRYVILTIIFVFDPLAVLMLIAANQGIAKWRAARQQTVPAADATVAPADSPEPLSASTAHAPISQAFETLLGDILLAIKDLKEVRMITITAEASSDGPTPPSPQATPVETGYTASDPAPQTTAEAEKLESLQRQPVVEDDIASEDLGSHDMGYIGLRRDMDETIHPQVEMPTVAPAPHPESISTDALFEHIKRRHQDRIDIHNSSRG